MKIFTLEQFNKLTTQGGPVAKALIDCGTVELFEFSGCRTMFCGRFNATEEGSWRACPNIY